MRKKPETSAVAYVVRICWVLDVLKEEPKGPAVG
jgi:hypothetical protein